MNKSIKIKALLTLIFAASFFFPCVSPAFPGGNLGAKPQCPMNFFFYTFFKITAEQQLQLAALQEETHAQLQPLTDQLRPLMSQLREDLLADVIDTEKADGVIADIVGLKEKILPIKMDSKVKASQILTAEQRIDMGAVRADITDFIDYILAYPQLDELKDAYSERIMRAMLDSNMNNLNLTEEQKTAIIALRNETQDAIEPIADGLRDLHESFAGVLLISEIDTAAAAELIDQMIAPASLIETLQNNMQVEEAQILTPEQRQSIRLVMTMHRGFRHPFCAGGK